MNLWLNVPCFFFIILFTIFNSFDLKLFLGHFQKGSEKYLVSIKQVSLYEIGQKSNVDVAREMI